MDSSMISLLGYALFQRRFRLLGLLLRRRLAFNGHSKLSETSSTIKCHQRAFLLSSTLVDKIRMVRLHLKPPWTEVMRQLICRMLPIVFLAGMSSDSLGARHPSLGPPNHVDRYGSNRKYVDSLLGIITYESTLPWVTRPPSQYNPYFSCVWLWAPCYIHGVSKSAIG